VALSPGFYTSNKQRAGDTFVVQTKGEKFKWARPAKPADVTADLGGEPALLDKSPKEIVQGLSGLTDVQLNGMIAAEQAGKMRKGVLAAISDELANRVGRVGGPEIKAKKPQEKEPKVPGDEPAAGNPRFRPRPTRSPDGASRDGRARGLLGAARPFLWSRSWPPSSISTT
jgi:hypothetical protein